MKRTISLILALVLLSVTVVPAFSAERAETLSVVYNDDGSRFEILIIDEHAAPESDDPHVPENTASLSGLSSFFTRIFELLKKIVSVISSLYGQNTNTVTKTKMIRYFDSKDVLLWTFYLEGSFSYNGTTASCVGAHEWTDIADKDWAVISSSSRASRSSAVGKISMRQTKLGVPLKTIEKEIRLNCSPDGVVS